METKAIEDRMESLEISVDFILQTASANLVNDLLSLFSSDPLLGHVFVAVDQSRTETDVMKHLQAKGLAISLPTTHRKLKVLRGKRLVMPVSGGRGKRFVRTPKLEQVFMLGKRVEALLKKGA